MHVEKLKVLKCNLKQWNKEVFGKVEENKKAVVKKLDYWDSVEFQRPLSIGELEVKVKASEDFKRWDLMEEVS